MSLRADLAIIADHVAAGSRVLDVGCGDGALMAALRDAKRADARGLELDPHNVAAAVGRGLSVIQGDADIDLAGYPDASFDYAILSQTRQTCRAPEAVLRQRLRIDDAMVAGGVERAVDVVGPIRRLPRRDQAGSVEFETVVAVMGVGTHDEHDGILPDGAVRGRAEGVACES